MLGLYFDMGIEGYSYGIRIYKQTSAGMAAIRKMAIEKQPEFTISLSNIKKLGAKLVGASYKKDHYPDIVDLELNTFLNQCRLLKRTYLILVSIGISIDYGETLPSPSGEGLGMRF